MSRALWIDLVQEFLLICDLETCMSFTSNYLRLLLASEDSNVGNSSTPTYSTSLEREREYSKYNRVILEGLDIETQRSDSNDAVLVHWFISEVQTLYHFTHQSTFATSSMSQSRVSRIIEYKIDLHIQEAPTLSNPTSYGVDNWHLCFKQEDWQLMLLKRHARWLNKSSRVTR